MDIKDFKRISEKKALAKKEAFKSLAEEDLVEIYENEIGKVLIGESGIFYENKLFPNRDYTYSNNYHKKFLTDDEVKNMIKRLQELRTKVNQNNSAFFYYGFMYKDGESHELSYNFHKNEKEEVGELKEEMPEVIKIKIYSDIDTVFEKKTKNGIIVILKLPEKNILVEVSHEEGNITTQL
ncbi:MAG: hypothetical protein KJ600_02585 [Nanoarchaeota archaeon]|nr:hypothetical protein [Nanoarchaeota archaeon]